MKDDMDFFLSLEEGTGGKYNVNVRQLAIKVKRTTNRGALRKTLLMESEMYNVLNTVDDKNFAHEITTLIMMMILWGMQRKSVLVEEPELNSETDEVDE